MATIPDVQDFGRRPIPRAARGVVSDQSGIIDAQATGQFARNAGQIFAEVQERDDRFSFAQAKSALLQADMEARKALENDQDWSTYEKRYGEAMAKARENAGKLIRGNRDRALFEQESKIDTERGLFEIRGKARAKEGDWGRATLDQMLETNRSAAMTAGDEPSRAAIINATKDAIRGAKDKGYIDESTATNAFQRWRDSYATGYMETLQPEQRVEALTKGGVADFLQPDVRARLLEHAKREGNDLRVRRESQVAEDLIAANTKGNWTQALKDAREIKDPEVRDSTVSRIKVRQAEANQAEAEFQNEVIDQSLEFINGGGKFADLPLKLKNSLKPSQLNSLRSYAEQGGRVRTDKAAYSELSTLYGQDPQKFGDLDLLEYKDKLSDQDWEEFRDLQTKVQSGSIDGKSTGYLTATQMRDGKVREIFGTTTGKKEVAKKIDDFKWQFDQRMRAFKSETGKQPKAADAKQILDDMTAEVSINWGRDKKVFELGAGDIPEVPEADRNEIIRELQKRGKPVTDEAIIGLYRRVNSK